MAVTARPTLVCLIIALDKITVTQYSYFDVAGTNQRWPQRPAS